MTRSTNTDFRRIQDQQGDTAEIDESGYTFSGDAVHRRINIDEEYFVCYEFAEVGAGSTVTLSIMTNGKFPHGTIRIASNAEFSYEIELSTVTTEPAGASQIYPHNLNRGCNHNRAVATFYTGTTAGGDGKQIECGHVGAADKFESIASAAVGDYWLLDSGRVYHVRVTNKDDAASYIVIKYRWHEHYPVPGDGTGEDEHEYDWEAL